MSIATNVSVTRECTAKLTHECIDSIILYNTLEGDIRQHEMSSVLLVVAYKYKVQPRRSKMKLVDCLLSILYILFAMLRIDFTRRYYSS